MSTSDPVQLVEPTPDVIVDFIGRVVGTPWPEDSAGFTAYFGSLGCTAGEPAEYSDPVPGSTTGPLAIHGFSMEGGSWSAFNGKVFFLGFFVYPGRQGSQAVSEVGFEAVRDRLSDIYGSPVDEAADAAGNRSALWAAEEDSIELYGHVTLAPVLQVGLSRRDVGALWEERSKWQ